jgi:cob(I)alamin adenosyltransferase
MSIATTHGDSGQTGLVGGIRVSKADLRVEAYGSTEVLLFQRSICDHSCRSLCHRRRSFIQLLSTEGTIGLGPARDDYLC